MSTSKPLDGRRAVVTGAGSGIGEAIALAYAQAGARLLLADIDAARAEDVARRCRALGTQAETVIGDVGDESTAHRIIDRCVQAFGGIDILVNNAGMLTQSRCADMSTAMWDEMLRVDLRSVFLCARRAVPHMQAQRWGRIISIASQLGIKGGVELSHYAAAKAGVIGFTKSLALELGADGIRVNAILPGAVDGPRIRDVIAAKAQARGLPLEDVTRSYTHQAALGRMATARDIANMAVFAASPLAGHVTGQELAVDGLTQALS